MRALHLIAVTLIFTLLTSFSPGFKVSSPAFAADGMIPTQYSCEGANVNPPLHIEGLPSGTLSLALVVHDPDAPLEGGFTHWVLWNIEVSGEIPENFKGAVQGLNGMHKAGYMGMCPPSGTHHYHFKVYALNAMLDIDKNTDMAALEKAMHGHILAKTELVGLYKKTR